MHIHSAGYISQPGAVGAYSQSNPSDQSQAPQSAVVSLSDAAIRAAKHDGAPQKYVMFDSFGTPAHRNPPQPSSALEEMIYARGAQRIDFTQAPPRWPDNNQVLDYETWLTYEKEIDQHTNDRIEIYEQAMVGGLSKEEIIKKIEQYNSTLGPRYYHSTSVEDRADDIERPKNQLPPAGSATPDILKIREQSYGEMVSAMTKVRKILQSYSG